jgi:type I restriction enzyme, S subunit
MDRQPLRTVVANPTVKSTDPMQYVALEHVEGGMGRLLDGAELAERKPGDCIVCQPGDVLFGKLRPYLAKSLLITDHICCSSELLVLRPRSSDVEPRFLAYVVQTHDFIEWANRDSYGVKMPRTSWQALGGFPFPVPARADQMRIADTLDELTQALDDAVGGRQRLVALLEERRRSAIVDAVTGGPTRRLGGAVEQVGHVHFPSEWARVRIKDLVFGLQGGDWGEEAHADDGVAVVRAADFNRTRLTVDEGRLPMRRIDEQKLPRLLLQSGDLVMEKSGGGEQQPVGMVVAFDLPLAAVASNFAARVRPSLLVDPRYLLYVFAGIYFSGLVTQFINQTTGIQNIDTEAIVECDWAIPDRDRQAALARSLDDETDRLNQAAELIDQEVGLFQQRRRAMITRCILGDEVGEKFNQ